MMWELVPMEEWFQPVWVDDIGDYNRMPRPYEQCSSDEYYQHAGTYHPQYVESRQVLDLVQNETFNNVTIEWYNDRAYVIRYPIEWHLDKNNKMVYDEPVRFYRVGCQHDYVELNSEECRSINVVHFGRCYHVERCSKCGKVRQFDSSD